MELAGAIQDITEQAQLLVQEEIELAKAEMTAKVTKLGKGAIFGIVAGVFVLARLIYLVDALAGGSTTSSTSTTALWVGLPHRGRADPDHRPIAGLVAVRLIKKGSPPRRRWRSRRRS